jgi:small-conductance mechanosensitive channel
MEPAPVVVFEGFGESSLNFLFGVWTVQANFLKLKNGIQEDIKRRFDEEGIEIPFPHRTLYVGSTTDAFPVKMVQGEAYVREGDADRVTPRDPGSEP